MEKSVFRKASLERISSPEQLNDYIKVSSPSVWIILAAVLILVAALFAWAIFGNIPTTYSATGEAKDGVIKCYFSPDDAETLQAGMRVKIGQSEGKIKSVSQTPLSYAETASLYQSDYTIHALGLSDWNVEVEVLAQVPDGLQSMTIIADEQKPIAFLVN